MCMTRFLFFSCLATQVKADPFSEFLIDEVMNSLREVVTGLNLDPIVIPTVGTQIITDKGIDIFHGGYAQLENGELVGISTFARTGNTGLKFEEDKAILTANIGIGEASANFDAVVAFFGIELSTGISAGITGIGILIQAEMNLQNPGRLELVDFQVADFVQLYLNLVTLFPDSG